jgi:acetyltransferase EpsM
MKETVIIGCGGHAKVVLSIIDLLDDVEVVGFYDDNKKGEFCNYPILGSIKDLNLGHDGYIIGIGNDKVRQEIYEIYPNINWISAIHPKSIIDSNVKIGKGTVICAGVIIQTEVKIGVHCIINTGCSIDHESKIGNFCNICPGAVICGRVKIGDLTFIGANATIIQCLSIGQKCLVGASSLVIKNITEPGVYIGTPLKKIK